VHLLALRQATAVMQCSYQREPAIASQHSDGMTILAAQLGRTACIIQLG